MSKITVELTEVEKAKYDLTYKSIIDNYTKKDKEALEDDEIAKFYLHNLVLKYVLTGEFPSNTDITNNIHLLSKEELEERYNATIPLEKKPEEEIVLERTPEEIKEAYNEKMKELRNERKLK